MDDPLQNNFGADSTNSYRKSIVTFLILFYDVY